MKIIKDNIYFQKKAALVSTLSFLKAIKQKLPRGIAFEIAEKAAANYSIAYYDKIFQGSKPGSQERFEIFRNNYESYPKTSPYSEILISNSNCLKVRFNRCPFAEVLKSESLFEFASASCLSDIAFTSKFLPEIKFTRESSIVDGDKTCIMKWEKKK